MRPVDTASNKEWEICSQKNVWQKRTLDQSICNWQLENLLINLTYSEVQQVKYDSTVNNLLIDVVLPRIQYRKYSTMTFELTVQCS